MIPEIKFLRAPATDGGAGSGATLPQAGSTIFERVAMKGQVPPDAEEVRQALVEIREMYSRLGVPREDIEVFVSSLENGRDAFPDGSKPVDFLKNGGFFGGNRLAQAQTGHHIMKLHQVMRQAIEILPSARNIE